MLSKHIPSQCGAGGATSTIHYCISIIAAERGPLQFSEGWGGGGDAYAVSAKAIPATMRC